MVVKRKPKPLMIILLVCSIMMILLGIVWMFLASPVDRHNQEIVEVEIASGTGTRKISDILKEKKLIHSRVLFGVYVKIDHVSSLKAGTYQFKQSMSLSEIVHLLEKGSTYNPNMVKLVFKEGARITDYAKVIEKSTNHSYDEVIQLFQDRVYTQELISKYWFLTDEILNADIYYPLEGYLAPNTYHFDDKDVDLKEIITTMLDENDERLSPYKESFGGKIHSYLTMASVVELEGVKAEDRKMIVGVFENRLSSGMNMGSDVTTYYGLQASMSDNLSSEQFSSVNAYNTRSTTMIGKLPVGPICNPSISSIEASISPTDNNYLFFVADKNGAVYYAKTMKEHEQKIAEIKAKGDWIW